MQTQMKLEKGTLDFSEQTIDPNAVYMVDWTKMQSVNDMVLVLASMAIAFPGNHPSIELLKPLLDLTNPMQKQHQPQQPAKVDLKMPKLNKIK